MKLRLIYLFGLLGFVYIFTVGFSGGVTSGLGDKTGSPLSSLGGTCEDCHSAAGLFTPTASIVVSDAGGFPVAR